ncbi:MAG: histidine kinase [Oscillospiraceae bacterium]|nr:histidine kinase [Oscillospiraceae bacterium]
MICNTVLDGCGILLLLLLLPLYFGKSSGSRLGRRKRDLLLYAALLHFFVLLLQLAGAVSVLALSHTDAVGIFTGAALLPALISAVLLALCVFCDENGVIRFSKKGGDIPVTQIACTVLPPVAALCLRIVFPSLRGLGLAWSVALQLNQTVIQIENEKHFEAEEQRLDRDQALLMTVQMQPHFIFNTLSSIETLCQTDAAAATEAIENLSGYLRGNIDALTSEALIPFNDELRHIHQYVALELADPARRFQFDYELDVRDFALPALTVQPIVENAVKHGALSHRDGTGRVLLSTEAFGEYIRITVTDNGTGVEGLTDAQRKKRGIGIENTRKRLAALCGGDLQISAGATGTKAVILIPKRGG